MGTQEHWEAIYGKKHPQELSWYLPHLGHSLQFIERAGLSSTAAIIDVGGGASTLADDLIARGYRNLTVLDLSEGAIAQARSRLGPDATAVNWLVGDITEVGLPEHQYDFWHDRAVFHFLTDEGLRQRYVSAVRRVGTSWWRRSVRTALNTAAVYLWSGTAPRGSTLSSEASSRKWATTARCITLPGAANKSSSTATVG